MAFPLTHPTGHHGADFEFSGTLNRVLLSIRSAIGWVCGLVIFFALTLGVASTVSAKTNVLPREILVVRSGSMTPTFRTGSVVVVRPITQTAAELLKVGDIVTFRSAANRSTLITHRIAAVLHPQGGSVSYTTKGDANANYDETALTPDRVVGKYSGTIRGLGYLMVGMRNPEFWLMVIAALGLAEASVALAGIAAENQSTTPNNGRVEK